MRIGIYYGSSTGATADVAERIAYELGVPSGDVHDISSVNAADVGRYDLVVLGTSTWGMGELQDDWVEFKDQLKPYLKGKKVALFGLGDSEGFGDTFCDGVGELYDEFKNAGCTFVGDISVDGYNYDSSKAEREGRLVGLLLDEMNQGELTAERISAWVAKFR